MKEVRLFGGKIAFVDNEDFERVSNFTWSFHKQRGNKNPFATGYASRQIIVNGVPQTIMMHRFILNAPADMKVDHKNGDSLDNRRENLRLATITKNNQNARIRIDNKSGFKGVGFYPSKNKFVARIRCNKKRYCLGYHLTAEEAARAYDKAARELHGEFARLNFPNEGEHHA